MRVILNDYVKLFAYWRLIRSRSNKNLRDEGVTLFSGAVGAVAISKEVKGVATSIPGVSIAVALMPPLCVVGYMVSELLSAPMQPPDCGLRVGAVAVFYQLCRDYFYSHACIFSA